MEYRIPVIWIQDKLLSIEKNKQFVDLKKDLQKIVQQKNEDYGIEGIGFRVVFDLADSWYPVFVFENQWLAAEFVKFLVQRYHKL